MRSGSPKPAASATRSIGSRPASTARAGRLQPQALDGLGRGDAGLGGEGAGEVARAHGRLVGQPLDARAARPAARAPSPAGAANRPSGRPSPAGRRTATGRRAGGGGPPAAGRSRRATASPRSSSIRASARSMPAVMPAEVQTSPSRTKMRSGSSRTFGIAPGEVVACGSSGWWRAGRPAGRPRPARRRRSRRWRPAAPSARLRCSQASDRRRVAAGARVPSPPATIRVSNGAVVRAARRPCATPEELAHRPPASARARAAR